MIDNEKAQQQVDGGTVRYDYNIEIFGDDLQKPQGNLILLTP